MRVKEFHWQETSNGDAQQTNSLFKGESPAISQNIIWSFRVENASFVKDTHFASTP